jgi:hypothetical protein
MDLHRNSADLHPAFTEVDLQLFAGLRLEANLVREGTVVSAVIQKLLPSVKGSILHVVRGSVCCVARHPVKSSPAFGGSAGRKRTINRIEV